MNVKKKKRMKDCLPDIEQLKEVYYGMLNKTQRDINRLQDDIEVAKIESTKAQKLIEKFDNETEKDLAELTRFFGWLRNYPSGRQQDLGRAVEKIRQKRCDFSSEMVYKRHRVMREKEGIRMLGTQYVWAESRPRGYYRSTDTIPF
jgi:hypothetical protein